MSVSGGQLKYIGIAIAVIATILFVGGTMLYAHEFGESFEGQDGDVFIDIGYSVENITDDTSVVFDFEILDSEENMIPFSDVWVRITQEKSTVFASGIYNARLGGALMTYKFPESGEYELSARFQDDGKSIAEGTFPVVVERGASRSVGSGRVVYAALGLLGGIILGSVPLMLLRRRRA